MERGERTPEQDLASGRPAWTPFALLASVAGAIAVLVVIALVLVVVAYGLA
ncbi:MAG TPA: hypothetical protein VFU99_06035 [Gaiellaceae bacterium]|nr:hypothetical protein [Gaiellaceae bacterium]